MEITLIRHGRSSYPIPRWLTAAEFAEGIAAYDRAGVDENTPPPPETIQGAEASRFRICSPLQRSLHSAQLLNIEKPDLVSPLFRECEMPHLPWRRLRLPPMLWVLSFRLSQLLGYAPNAESKQAFYQRIALGAAQLEQLAAEHGQVLVVGHGILNIFLHKQLISSGWQGPAKPVKRHWQMGRYTRAD